MRRPHFRRAFTLIEMITVIAILAILAGLILSINGLIQRKSATARAEVEMKALATGCESYKIDNGSYPQDAATDKLDAQKNGSPLSTAYQSSSLYLYKVLSGDTDANGQIGGGETAKNYVPDFFRPSRLGGTKNTNGQMTQVTYILDPFGFSYGYSTAGLLLEQDFRTALSTNPAAQRPAQNSQGTTGYNSTFDLWSTAGTNIAAPTDADRARWVKNW